MRRGGEPDAVVAGLGIADVQEGVAGFFEPAEVDAEAAEDVQMGGTAGLARQEGRQGVQGAVQGVGAAGGVRGLAGARGGGHRRAASGGPMRE